MAFTVFQGGTALYGMDARGSITSLSLPTGVTLSSSLRPRFALIGNFAVLVNSPSRPLTIDANLVVRVLTPEAPTAKMTLTGPAAGGLTGSYRARQTFLIKDQNGNVIAESDFGPTADSVTIAAKTLKASGINLSGDTVSASRLYRTATGGSVYFPWIELDGNTQTTIQDDLSDAGLATVSAASLGTPPNLYLISEFKGRLFGVDKEDLNNFRYTEINAPYSWPEDNIQPLPLPGTDSRGITGFVRRRDGLGIGRANGLFQLTGTSDDDFRITTISENLGIEATDSVCVYRNVAYFLWKDGVYRWDDGGVTNVSAGKVGRWFTRNGTFNLSRLQFAFAHLDGNRKKYRLFLASAASNVENCWIEYDFEADKWWGPHLSHAFTPTAAFSFASESGLVLPMTGGDDGYCRMDRTRRVDDANTGIDFDVVTSREDMEHPDDEKYFGELSVSTKPLRRGIMDVYTTVGEVDEPRLAKDNDANPTPPFSYDLRRGRERLGRVGIGKAFKLRFRNNKPDEDVHLRGYEVAPVFLIGKR